MEKTGKIEELDGKKVAKKEEVEKLRGKVIVLRPEESEIAKHLDIKEKGVYGIRFRWWRK